MEKGIIFSICIRPKTETTRKEVPEVIVREYGLENDGYEGEWGREWGRQISLLNLSSVLNFNKENNQEAGPGTFDENILVEGVDLNERSVGDTLQIGEEVFLEITQIGKENTLVPASKHISLNLLSYEGVFCKVIQGGKIKKGDPIAFPGKAVETMTI